MFNPEALSCPEYRAYWVNKAIDFVRMAEACRADHDYSNARLWNKLADEALDNAQSGC